MVKKCLDYHHIPRREPSSNIEYDREIDVEAVTVKKRRFDIIDRAVKQARLELQEKENMDRFDNEPVGPDSFAGSDDESHYVSRSAEEYKKEVIQEFTEAKMNTFFPPLKEALEYFGWAKTVKEETERINHGWIQLYSGRKFYPLDPRPEDIDIQDIAHSLSHQCRFTGHVKSFYSVAQHSVLVSYLCGPSNALWGLLHDASEAYLVDVPKPLKRLPLFQAYRDLEKKVQEVICQKFQLPLQEPRPVKDADIQMLATEARDLMSPLHPDWVQPCDPYPFKIEPMQPAQAKELFLKRYKELAERVGLPLGGDISGSYPTPMVKDFK